MEKEGDDTKLGMNGNDHEEEVIGDKDVGVRSSLDNSSTFKSRGFSIDHLLNSKSGEKSVETENKSSARFGTAGNRTNFRIADFAMRHENDEDVIADDDSEDLDEDDLIPDGLHMVNHLPPPPLLIRPTPLSAANAVQSHLGGPSSESDLLRLSPPSGAESSSSNNPASLMYGSPPPPSTALSPNHMLYSQWLATRNTNALFGLQGRSCIAFFYRDCSIIQFEFSLQIQSAKI